MKIELPPLLGDDGKKQSHVLSVTWAMETLTVAILDEGGGAFIELRDLDGDKARFDPKELTAFAMWAEVACRVMDEHNGQEG